MRISDWSSDVCSSDLPAEHVAIRVGKHICHWREGETLIFDDSFNHEVWNDTDDWRVVLFIDFARPLRQPWHAINRALLGIARFLPLLRRASRRHRDWKRDRKSTRLNSSH